MALRGKGRLAELQHRPEEAINFYRNARKHGDASPRLGQHLVELLYKQRRYREAQDLIKELSNSGQE